MNDWLDRLKEERKELFEKMGNLNGFLHSDHLKDCVNEEEISLLEIQYSCMEGYLKTLNRRLEVIELKK